MEVLGATSPRSDSATPAIAATRSTVDMALRLVRALNGALRSSHALGYSPATPPRSRPRLAGYTRHLAVAPTRSRARLASRPGQSKTTPRTANVPCLTFQRSRTGWPPATEKKRADDDAVAAQARGAGGFGLFVRSRRTQRSSWRPSPWWRYSAATYRHSSSTI